MDSLRLGEIVAKAVEDAALDPWIAPTVRRALFSISDAIALAIQEEIVKEEGSAHDGG